MNLKLILPILALIILVAFVTLYATGNLPFLNSQPKKLCPLALSPVCGANGVTYNNSCIAQSAGVTIVSQGACPVCNKAANGVVVDSSGSYAAHCLDKTSLITYNCINGHATNSTNSCGAGYWCNDDACIQFNISTPVLTQTGCIGPLAANYSLQSSVTFNGVVYPDACTDANTLNEFICSNGTMVHILHKCQVCSAGTCVNLSPICSDYSSSSLLMQGHITNSSGIFFDSCSGGVATKYSCSGTIKIDCPSHQCSGNVCTPSTIVVPGSTTPTSTCIDHSNPSQYVGGKVIANEVVYSDSCSGGVATKYSCSGTREVSSTISCDSGVCDPTLNVCAHSSAPTLSDCSVSGGVATNSRTGVTTHDSCVDSTDYAPATCVGNTPGSRTAVPCPSGTRCITNSSGADYCAAPPSVTCTVSDPSLDLTTPGTATNTAGATTSDRCDAFNSVDKAYCNGNTPDHQMPATCPSGTTCTTNPSGVAYCAAPPSVTCTGPARSSVSAESAAYTVSNGTASGTDACTGSEGSTRVVKWFCDANAVTSDVFTCASGYACHSGACILTDAPSCSGPTLFAVYAGLTGGNATITHTDGTAPTVYTPSCSGSSGFSQPFCSNSTTSMFVFISCGTGQTCNPDTQVCHDSCKQFGYLTSGSYVTYGNSTTYDACKPGTSIIYHYSCGASTYTSPTETDIDCSTIGTSSTCIPSGSSTVADHCGTS